MTLRYARLNPAYTRAPVQELAANFTAKHRNSLSDGEFSYVEKKQPVHEIDTKIFELGA